MWTDRAFGALLAAALGVRIAFLLLVGPEMVLQGDEHVYTKHARDLIDLGVFETGWFVRPPLYFVFLAGTAWLSDALGLPWPLLSKLLQCAAAAATAIPIYRGAARVAGTRAARIAVAFFAFDPTGIGYTAMLWPETLYTLAVAFVFDGVSRMDEGRPGRLAALGATAGVAMLLKPVFGLFTLLLALHWWRRHGLGGALRRALVFGGVAAVVIAPWVIRNQLVYGPSIVLENQGTYNLWSGNSTETPRRTLTRWRRIDDPVERSRVALERGREAIADDPLRFAGLYAVRAINLWGLEFFVYRHLVYGGFGWVTRAEMTRTFWALQIGWALTWLAASLGIASALRDPPLRLVGLYALVFTLLVAALVSTTRFRVPFVYLIAISAGIGVDRALDRRFARGSLAAFALALAVLCASAARPMFRMLIAGDFDNAGDVNQNLDWMWFRY